MNKMKQRWNVLVEVLSYLCDKLPKLQFYLNTVIYANKRWTFWNITTVIYKRNVNYVVGEKLIYFELDNRNQVIYIIRFKMRV